MFRWVTKAEEISKTLYGKKIVGVFYDGEKQEGTSSELEVDGGDIYILLDDGTVIKVWNSEWGGIEVTTKRILSLMFDEPEDIWDECFKKKQNYCE